MDPTIRLIVVSAIKRYRLVLSLIVIATIVAGSIAVFQPSAYQATALVLVARADFRFQFDDQSQTANADPSKTPKVLLALGKSHVLAERVAERTKDYFPAGRASPSNLLAKVTVSQREDPTLIQIAVTDQDANRAATIANAWAEEYVAYINAIYQPQSAATKKLQEEIKAAEEQLKSTDQAVIDFVSERELTLRQQELEAKLEARQKLVSLREGARVSIVSTNVSAQTLELEKLLEAKSRLHAALRDAQSLHDQIGRDGNSPAVQSGLSVLLVEVEALNTSGTSPVQIQVPFDREALATSSTASTQIALESLIPSLQEKEKIIEQQIEASSKQIAGLNQVGLDVVSIGSTTNDPPAGSVEAEIRRLTEEINRLQSALDNDNRTAERLRLERDTAKNAYSALQRKLSEVNINSQVAGGDLRLVANATVPATPVRSSISTFAIVGLAIGAVLGTVIAIGLEYLPASLRRLIEEPAPGAEPSATS